MEPEMEPETLEARIRECPGGRGPGRNRNRRHEAGPFPTGAGYGAPPPHAPPPAQEGRCPESVLRPGGEGRPHPLRGSAVGAVAAPPCAPRSVTPGSERTAPALRPEPPGR